MSRLIGQQQVAVQLLDLGIVGYPPLGYEVKDRKLIINEDDAATMRRIFQRFSELRSVTEVCRELALEGLTTRPVRLKDGGYRNGTPMAN